jgi:FtsP/CotA-like multicopper oxidase with cupredoxin domain
MTNQFRKTKVKGVLLALVLILGLGGTSQAAEYWLRADTITKTMPDGAVITMWGLANCVASFATCSAATVPGPELNVPVGDTTLTVHLRNNLTGAYTEPISLIIPGQQTALAPVMADTDTSGRLRVTSFVAETPVDNGNSTDYVWNNIKAGTYLYQSGTHPAVQVQMGLYGAMVHDAAAGQAYGASTAYAASANLIFSEIDPALHSAVALATYGTASYPSTIHYAPKYFLINGTSFTAGSSILPAGSAGGTTLLRFLNAGLQMRAPTLNGLHMTAAAEDGNLYPFGKSQYSLLLAPGKTIDALITPATYGSYAVFDRRLGMADGTGSTGGMLAYLTVTPGAADRIGVYTDGTWYLDADGSGAWDGAPPDSVFGFGLGLVGAQAVAGDWTGAGASHVGVFLDGGTWYRDLNGNGAWDGEPTDSMAIFGAGIPGANAVAGDWSGSGSTKIGVYLNHVWWIDYSGNAAWDGPVIDRTFTFDPGTTGAVPVAGDWNGAGSAKAGEYLNGTWYLDLNGNGVWDGTPADGMYTFNPGTAGAVPVTGDWTMTGSSKIGVYDNGTWYVDLNGNGAWDGTPADAMYLFGVGLVGASPVTGAW